MGTLDIFLELEPCEHCGKPRRKLHVGRMSTGHTFKLNVRTRAPHFIEGDDTPENMLDWVALLDSPKNTIRDEYGMKITYASLVSSIFYPPHDALRLEPDGIRVRERVSTVKYDSVTKHYWDSLA